MTHKVLVTCKQMQESLGELLAENPMPDFSFTTPELTKQGFTSSEMAELIKGHDAAIVGDDVLDEPVISISGLRLVCKWGAGVDGIDFYAAKKQGVRVVNTPGIFGSDVADLAFSYLVALGRSTYHIDASVRRGDWPRVLGRSLRGMKIAIYGFGDIGSHLSRMLIQSGARVIAIDNSQTALEAARSHRIVLEDNVESACLGADALVVCVPLNPQTKNSVDEKVLASMSADSILVNISRGGVVVEEDLIRALTKGKLRGAALDVYQVEPLPMDSGLRDLPNVVFGSHNASNTDVSVIAASKKCLEALVEGIS